jgi:flagellar basal body rod protein FlgG
MSDFDILGAAVSGMQAQRAAMDVDARNVALSQTGDIRHPAFGLVPQFVTLAGAPADGEPAFADVEARMNGEPDAAAGSPDEQGAVVAFTGVRRGSQPVDAIGEMVNVLDAQRAYEADASIFDIGKRLFQRTIEMGRL